jgi:hypothetical protein
MKLYADYIGGCEEATLCYNACLKNASFANFVNVSHKEKGNNIAIDSDKYQSQ